MRLTMGTLAFAIALPLSVAASAADFVSTNNMWVSGSATEFEVFARAGRNNGPQMFCAAADYAWRRLSARSTDRLVVTRGLSPSPTDWERESMGFRLASAADAPRSSGWNLTLLARRGQGQTRSVGHARMFCNDR